MERKNGMTEKRRRRFVNISFTSITILTIVTWTITLWDGFSPGNTIIFAAFLAFFWYLSIHAKISRTAVVAGCTLIMLDVIGLLLHPWRISFAGVTYDTYLHLIGGFVAMMFASTYISERVEPRWHPMLIAFGVAMILGLGLEVVELAEEIVRNNFFTSDCWHSFCFYWQDTIKDIINDALGAAFFVVARIR